MRHKKLEAAVMYASTGAKITYLCGTEEQAEAGFIACRRVVQGNNMVAIYNHSERTIRPAPETGGEISFVYKGPIDANEIDAVFFDEAQAFELKD